jgi:hypothetical protein
MKQKWASTKCYLQQRNPVGDNKTAIPAWSGFN